MSNDLAFLDEAIDFTNQSMANIDKAVELSDIRQARAKTHRKDTLLICQDTRSVLEDSNKRFAALGMTCTIEGATQIWSADWDKS